MMELILWRHADAEDALGRPDAERALTRKGRKQAERMADWLRPRIDADWCLLVSPARRALETVEPLRMAFDLEDRVGLSANAQSVLRTADWPRSKKNILVVGHQPTLGETAALLIGGEEGGVSIRKGAVWWFATRERDGATETILKLVMSPEELE